VSRFWYNIIVAGMEILLVYLFFKYAAEANGRIYCVFVTQTYGWQNTCLLL